MKSFNIRVYGFLLDDQSRLLISDEEQAGMRFTKLPGGGLELGEGLRDALMREFEEECSLKVEVLDHVHTTDICVPSVFNDTQVISVYYLVSARQEDLNRLPTSTIPFDFGNAIDESENEDKQSFRWVSLKEFNEEQLTFEIDRLGWRAFKKLFPNDVDESQG